MINALKVADTSSASITSAPLRVEALVQQGSLNLSTIYRCFYLPPTSRISLFFHKFACFATLVESLTFWPCFAFITVCHIIPQMLRNVEHG